MAMAMKRMTLAWVAWAILAANGALIPAMAGDFGDGRAVSRDQFPPEVAAHVQEMNDVCEGSPSSDGKPKPGQSGTYDPVEDGEHFKFHPRSLVEHVILKGSGAEVWAIDEGRYQCDGGPASLFSGSGGSQVFVFARLGDGQVKQVFVHGAYGMSLTLSGAASAILLQVGGPLCGQTGEPSHGDSISCSRPLLWDQAAVKMDFAPLSEAKFPSGEPPKK